MVREIKPVIDARSLIGLARWMRQNRFDVVHTHGSKAGFVGRLAAKIVRVPVIVHTAHGWAFNPFQARRTFVFYLTLERLAARWCDAIICVSGEQAAWTRQLHVGRPSQVHTILYGIPVKPRRGHDATASPRTELGARLDTSLILSVARLMPQKNHADLLRAMSLLREDVPSAKLLLAGDGALRERLETLAQSLGLDSSVQFLGFRTDVDHLLDACDVFVLSSLWEGMPLALLEAMAAEKAVIATDIMGTREAIRHGETGVLVPPRDPHALAAAIEELVKNREKASAMARRAREEIENRFSLERHFQELQGLYEGLLNRKRTT
jgi:glycosyltransferase involved in cell wall biosynthesis